MDLYQLRIIIDFGKRHAINEVAEAAIVLKAKELVDRELSDLVKRIQELELVARFNSAETPSSQKGKYP